MLRREYRKPRNANVYRTATDAIVKTIEQETVQAQKAADFMICCPEHIAEVAA
jgi:hypothetical protein